jgi:hypothetical protein
VNDTRIEKLGIYFCHFEIYKRYGMTFEKFVQLVVDGLWKEIVQGGL